jgi:hypothetical protein
MPRRLAAAPLAAVALAAAVLLFAGTADASWNKPWFCHELDCPEYEVVENLTSIGVELRRYAPSRWVQTTIENATSVAGPVAPAGPARSSAGAMPRLGGGGGSWGAAAAGGMPGAAADDNASTGYERAVAAGFYKLFRYISGENLTGARLAMTSPVKVTITPSGPTCGDSFTIGFFIAPNVTSPPPPTDSTVKIVQQPEQAYYVHGFGGWATGATYIERARSVATALEGAGRKTDDSCFATAGYDSPFRLRGRHNEVWLTAVGVEQKGAGAAKVQAVAAAAKPAVKADVKAAKPAVVAAPAKAAAPKAAAPVAKPAAALKLPTVAAKN